MIYNIKHVSLKRPNLAIISLKDIILTDDGEWKLLTKKLYFPLTAKTSILTLPFIFNEYFLYLEINFYI